jgi:hypothetical protein
VNFDSAIDARLTALTAGTEAIRQAARDEAAQLIDAVDWCVLAERLETRRLLPLLGERIIMLAGSRAPESFVEATRRAIQQCYEQDRWLELITAHVTDVLRGAGIPSLPLKGPTLGKALYGELGRRPSADIDVLVAREDLPGAIATAARLGYRSPGGEADAPPLPLLHVRLDHTTRALPPLEVHWRVHWYESRFSRELLHRSIDSHESGSAPPLSHELASLLLFYARDGFVDLRLACDLAAWWDMFGPQLGAGALSAIIEDHPKLERALLAAVAVANGVVGLPSAELLAEHHRQERRVQLAERLANPEGQGSEQQLVADMWLVDWLLTPPGGRRDCIWRQLHAPGDVESGWAGPISPTRHPVASLNRAARLIPRYTFSLLRLTLGQAAAPAT